MTTGAQVLDIIKRLQNPANIVSEDDRELTNDPVNLSKAMDVVIIKGNINGLKNVLNFMKKCNYNHNQVEIRRWILNSVSAHDEEFVDRVIGKFCSISPQMSIEEVVDFPELIMRACCNDKNIIIVKMLCEYNQYSPDVSTLSTALKIAEQNNCKNICIYLNTFITILNNIGTDE